MWVLSRDRQQKSITLEPRLRANNVFAVRDAAITGHGIALLPLTHFTTQTLNQFKLNALKS
jgi:DNA-binding transcriptional LysR family regulator